MPAITQFFIGDTKKYRFTITNKSDNSAVNIANWEFWITFKDDKSKLDQKAILQKKFVVSPGPDATAGIVDIILTSDDTNKFVEEGQYFYDIQRVIPGTPPDVYTIEEGKVKILRGVTWDDEDHATVPTLTNILLATAQTQLLTLGFTIGDITSESSMTITSGNVISTTPAAGSWVELGTAINIKVAT